MKGHMKKAVALGLAAVMVFGISPVSVKADEVTAQETTKIYKYVTMNVPYSDFYAAYGVTASAVTSKNGVDVVSTATQQKFKQSALAAGTYNDGTDILGITIPVCMDEATYEALAKDNKLSAAATPEAAAKSYAFADLKDTPSVYSTVTYQNGKYNFSALETSSIKLGDIKVTCDNSGSYGDYMLIFEGITPDGKITTATGTEQVSIYGAVLKTDAGKAFGMTCLENIWFGTRVPSLEIAYSVKSGQQLKNHGGVLFHQFADADLNGATISSVDLVTSAGVINVPCNLKTISYVSAPNLQLSLANDSNVLGITGLPDSFSNAKVTVSHKEGRTVKTDVTDVVITNNKVALPANAVAGATYTVTITSGQNMLVKTTATPISDAQKKSLEELAATAKATTSYDSNKTLQEHVKEAEDIVNDAAKTSADAAELIQELDTLIYQTRPTATATATLTGKVLKVELSVDFGKLTNPEYKLTSGEGNTVTELESGNLPAASVTLSQEPVVDTEYTLTISSDNYQDVTAKVTAAAENKQPEQEVQAGTIVKDKASAVSYKILDTKAKTVSYKATTATGKVTVPAAIKVAGVTYKVTQIEKNAFRNNKKITSITIGKNVTKIGSGVFAGCTKLKTITIKSTKLTKKSISVNTFKNISTKTVIKVPAAQKAAYTKLFRANGLSQKVVIK